MQKKVISFCCLILINLSDVNAAVPNLKQQLGTLKTNLGSLKSKLETLDGKLRTLKDTLNPQIINLDFIRDNILGQKDWDDLTSKEQQAILALTPEQAKQLDQLKQIVLNALLKKAKPKEKELSFEELLSSINEIITNQPDTLDQKQENHLREFLKIADRKMSSFSKKELESIAKLNIKKFKSYLEEKNYKKLKSFHGEIPMYLSELEAGAHQEGPDDVSRPKPGKEGSADVGALILLQKKQAFIEKLKQIETGNTGQPITSDEIEQFSDLIISTISKWDSTKINKIKLLYPKKSPSPLIQKTIAKIELIKLHKNAKYIIIPNDESYVLDILQNEPKEFDQLKDIPTLEKFYVLTNKQEHLGKYVKLQTSIQDKITLLTFDEFIKNKKIFNDTKIAGQENNVRILVYLNSTPKEIAKKISELKDDDAKELVYKKAKKEQVKYPNLVIYFINQKFIAFISDNDLNKHFTDNWEKEYLVILLKDKENFNKIKDNINSLQQIHTIFSEYKNFESKYNDVFGEFNSAIDSIINQIISELEKWQSHTAIIDIKNLQYIYKNKEFKLRLGNKIKEYFLSKGIDCVRLSLKIFTPINDKLKTKLEKEEKNILEWLKSILETLSNPHKK